MYPYFYAQLADGTKQNELAVRMVHFTVTYYHSRTNYARSITMIHQ